MYACDYRKYYLLEEDEWKFDTIPEFMDGKNVMDFFDADIEARLSRLEEEEAELEAQVSTQLRHRDLSQLNPNYTPDLSKLNPKLHPGTVKT